jgi:hypothetical protein
MQAILWRALRKAGVVALAAGVTIGTAATAIAASPGLKSNGHPKLANPNHIDAPDPAMVSTGGTSVQIYTSAADNAGYMNIPTWNWDYAARRQNPGGYNDALPTSAFYPAKPTNWATNARVRGPAVRRMRAGGPYVLAWSGSPRNGNQNCIGLATSLVPGGPFAETSRGNFRNGWCPTNPNVALVDPYLFTDRDGTNWMYFSRQDLSGPSSTPTGDLYVVELTDTGMSRVGSPRRLVTYADVAGATPACTGANSAKSPRLENPAMVQDPFHRGFDLFASFGSALSGCYRTVEIGCKTAAGGCVASQLAVVALPGSSPLTGTGGASFMKNVDPNGNQVVFAGFGGGFPMRQAYIDSTKCTRANGSAC